MEKLRKEMVHKAEKAGDRVIRFVGSNGNVDRDGDSIPTTGWNLKNYKTNPVVLINHQRPSDAVSYAKTKRVWIDKKTDNLMFDIEFPPPEVSSVGDSLFKWYEWAGVGTTSVGFIPDWDTVEYKDVKGKKVRIIHDKELVEISLVSTPSNPTALMTNKSLEDALEAKVIDEVELTELKAWFKSIESTEELQTHEDIEEEVEKEIDEVALLKARVAELELLIKEQEMEEGLEDDPYTEIFDKMFTGQQAAEKDEHTAEHTATEMDIDEINKLFEE